VKLTYWVWVLSTCVALHLRDTDAVVAVMVMGQCVLWFFLIEQHEVKHEK